MIAYMYTSLTLNIENEFLSKSLFEIVVFSLQVWELPAVWVN